jgi:hypothetical protein
MVIDMAHYAFLDSNNVVTEVIPGKNEGDDGIDNWEQQYSDVRGQVCKRTSFNTVANVHLLGGTPFRGNCAGIGYIYREDIDAFVPPQPYPSWILDSNVTWQPPVTIPTDDKMYSWNEETLSWVEVIAE